MVKKAPFSDAADRDRIKQNFAGDPNTTVTTAGGEPLAADRRLGQNGWDYSGTLDGLEAAIRKAGDAIKLDHRARAVYSLRWRSWD